MWMRYTLSRMTPVLRHLLATGVTRPFDLYTALGGGWRPDPEQEQTQTSAFD